MITLIYYIASILIGCLIFSLKFETRNTATTIFLNILFKTISAFVIVTSMLKIIECLNLN